MSHRSQLSCWAGLLSIPLLGCTAGESDEKNMGTLPNGLSIESKWTNSGDILASETQKALQFPYALANVSDQPMTLRLTRTSCGCAAVSVTSVTTTKPLARGSIFTIEGHESVIVTLDVQLAGKPVGLHNFPTELSVVNAGSEEPFSLPVPHVRILADISADPPVLSHQFRWNDDSVLEKRITITTLQRIEGSEHLPLPKLGPLPNYIVLKDLQKIESAESDKYRTDKWLADFSLKKPITEDYTVAASIRVSFPGSPDHTITIPSVVTAKRGVEARPRSLTFAHEGTTQNDKRIVLITATDGRPFSITRMSTRAGTCHVKVRESKTSVSYLIDIVPVSPTNLLREDTLEIETDHPDTPSITAPLLRAG